MSNSQHKNTTPFETVWQDYVPSIAWGTIALFFAYVAAYIIVVTAALSGALPYLVATPVCGYLTYVGFTVVHDAGHGSIVKLGSRLKVLEPILGWIASVPLLLVPYPAFKQIHDRHHAFANDPDRDPDHFFMGEFWYQVLANCLFMPVQYHITLFKLRHIKSVRDTFPSTLAYFSLILSLVIALAYLGYFVELLLLLFIPNVIAVVILTLFFDYFPHYPHKSLNRFQDSRIYDSALLNVLLLGQNYHLIHHMYPRLPWYKYKGVYQRIKPELIARHAPIDDLSNGIVNGFLSSTNGWETGYQKQGIHLVLKVANITPLTDDAVLVCFDLPATERFAFKAGQYVVVSKWLDNAQHSRCYSLCSSPESGQVAIGVKHHELGRMSGFINTRLNAGDELIIQGPFGNFVYPAEHELVSQQLVLIAGGSGITPILSILKTALNAHPVTNIHLLYLTKSPSQTLFFDQLEDLRKRFASVLRITYVHSEESGRLTSSELKRWLSATKNSDKTDFYVCGPQELIDTTNKLLTDLNAPKERVHSETFLPKASVPNGPLYQVNISLSSGQHYQLEVAANQTVLEVAKQHGVPLNHACERGVCGSCKIRVVNGCSGPIPDTAPGISHQEQTAGFALACQCKPLSDLSLKSEE